MRRLSRAGDPVFDGGPGSDDVIVLITAHHADAFTGQHTYDSKVDVANADFLSDRIFLPEELFQNRLPDQANTRGTPHILKGEGVAFNDVPLANGEKFGRGAEHIIRVPVAIPVNDLGPAVHAGSHRPHSAAFAADGFRIIERSEAEFHWGNHDRREYR